MILRNRDVTSREGQTNRRALQLVSRRFTRAIRMGAPTFLALAFVTAAHAQGSIDMAETTTLMNTFKTCALYAGAVICLGCLIFAGIKMMSGNFQ